MTRPLPRLLLITDRRRVVDLPGAVERALAAVPSGSTGIILREKDLEGRALATLARALRHVTATRDAPLFVNGRLDIAVAVGADGVHLGGDAPPFSDVRRQAPPGFLIGVSVHGEERPPEQASYALVSPVFPTASKPGASTLAVEGLRAACARTRVPVFALGGIDFTNVGACRSAGAWGAAVLGSVLPTADPAAACSVLVRAMAAIDT